MSYAAVVVLHESRDELAALLRSLERLSEPPRLIVVDTGPDDGGADARRATARVIVRRDNPGLRRGQQRRRSSASTRT